MMMMKTRLKGKDKMSFNVFLNPRLNTKILKLQ